jgi:bacterioferritin-associated ferredoxin
MICVCNRVDGKDLKKLLRKFPDASVSELARLSGASMSCGRCGASLSVFVEKNRPLKNFPLTLFKRDDY